MSGLVQDYSKSPIKSTPAVAPPTTRATQNVLNQASGPQPQDTPSRLSYAPPKTQIAASTPHNYGAPPPRKSMDQRPPYEVNPPKPMGQQPDAQVLPVHSTANAYTPNTYGTPVSPVYGQAAPQLHGSPYVQHQPDQGGYRQNPVHDGGSTDYSADGESSLEFAGRTWKVATQTVSEYTSTAGEVAGNALGSFKGWLNPESKGMR